MTADDTSREALIEQVARRIHEAADYEVPVMPWDQQTDDWRAEVSSLAAAVVDAVVMPLVQERDRLAAEKAKWQAEALREAAAWLDSFEGPGGRTSLHDRVGRDLIRLLGERADHIEKGSDDDR